MDYTGPSIGTDGEEARRRGTIGDSRSSAWSNIRFEKATIKSFSQDGNIAAIETLDGELYPSIRVQTPIEVILLMYGEVEKLFDIPCLLIYRSVPEDGFVQIGDLAPIKEEDGSRSVSNPFYL